MVQIAHIHLLVMTFVMIGSTGNFAILMVETVACLIKETITAHNAVASKMIQHPFQTAHLPSLWEMEFAMILQIQKLVDMIMVCLINN